MGIKNRSKSVRIKEAAIKDGINYIIGLSKIPIPLEIVKEVIDIKKEESTSHFVDWELKNWPKIYSQELQKCLKLLYKGKEFLLPQVLIFDNTEKQLKMSNIYFHLLEKPFTLREDIRALTEELFEKLLNYLRKKKRYSNQQNLRLISIREECKKVVLEVQPVEYKHYVHTNLLLDAKSKGKEQTLREYCHSHGKIEELIASPLANHLGINILLFTADGSCIMQKRSKKVAVYIGELCAAASGAVSLTDIPSKETTLEEMPKLREGFEEIGISITDIPKDQIFFLGITRELIRGGKPEMFFFGKTNLSEKQVIEKWKDAKDKWEASDLVFFHFGKIAFENLVYENKIHEFLCKVDDFIEKHIEESSISLLTNLALWVKYRLKTEGRLDDDDLGNVA